MSPYRDMFKDFVDLSTQGRVVRLGDDNKTIPILGQGTLCLTVQGKTLALANTLYVPDLLAILLSSRVLRRMAPGCALVADHDGCFLTFPSFTFEIDDARDCTLPCTRVPSDTRLFDFDSRLHLSQHASTHERRDHRQAIQVTYMHQARLAGLRKSQAHLDPHNLRTQDGSLAWSHPEDPATKDISTSKKEPLAKEAPIRPVYSVSNSATKAEERMSSYDLKRMFGCRSLNDWRMLERTGTGLHVVHEGSPLTIGDMATINRNRYDKLLDRPKTALHTIGMDIGYGEGTSPGGYKYALTLVDFATRHTWVYGLRTKSSECIIDTLWCFYYIDAGGFPTRIRCDFDSSFVKGKVYSFLRRRGIRVGASPPGRQPSFKKGSCSDQKIDYMYTY
jgi:hypothetical protein